MGNYVGAGPSALEQKSYFYGLKRDDAGNLYFGKVDLTSTSDSVTLVDLTKRSGTEAQYEFPGVGSDYFEGRNADHTLVNPSLNYEQYKWTAENMYYFLNDQGQLVLRINNTYSYS